MEMDSDFSHDPADLPRLVAATEDADLVLGSRYVPGGGVTDWGLGRRVISRGGSLYAQVILGIPVRDLTGGFKCFRRAVLEGAGPERGRHRRLRLPDRGDLPRGAGRLPRPRGADRVPRPPRGASKMSWRIALGGLLEGPAAAACDRGSRVAILSEVTETTRKEPQVAGAVSEVSDNNFQAEVIENDQPVLVDFWAPWCGPCRVVAPHLEELAGERDDLRVVKLNVDDNPQTAASYNVMSIPTILLFKNGEVATRSWAPCPRTAWCRRSSRRWPRPSAH